ncbi:hypothetical protein D6D19_03863 [Aureobasidium pullulans]|uniref:Uncharacterized protein n=1 Tax=Aureobasidium pullulans TaxID=5580 RepID=A0A4S9A901_AURPU|nr:hypothetical protein D6D19_03863 [Aureobasidium pullulans]
MPDLMEDFPLPDLANALGPYIRPREEVAEIRRGIDSFLAQHVQHENIPTSKATLPITETSTQSVPENITGVRRAFMQALIARQKAQNQYDALKAELNLMQNKPEEQESNESKANPVAETVALIRQRQRRDKLLVIEKTLDNLEKVRHTSRYADPSELLNGMQAQLPPPLAQQSQDESLAEAQSHVFELQKAVLRAQSSVQSRPSNVSVQETNPEDWKRAYALRRARDDLIAWLESELAKLSEDDDHMDPDLDMPTDFGAESLDETRATLQDLYSKYIASRERLVSTLNIQYKTKSNPVQPPLERQTSTTNDDKSNNTGMALRVLPFIDILRSTAQDETAMMQHTSYLRRQVTAVSTETEQLLTRLSDESHMVRPGTSHTAAWAEAAKDARFRDMEMVDSHLAAGETSIKGVRDVLALTQKSE